MYIENFDYLISDEKAVKTEQFMLEQIAKQAGENDGEVLLKSLKIPYLKMPVPPAPWDEMLVEAVNLLPQFVSHRSDDSQGWKSLCLHGIGNEKTLSFDRYGYGSDAETPYGWTEASRQCPQTTSWLQRLLDEKYFNKFFRVRFMLLEPGGYITFHRDREDGENSLGPLNVALNMPEKCYWLFKRWGRVPFHAGAAMCVDISNEHSVVNLSNENRIHIIVHGCYGPNYYEGLVKGARQFRALSALKDPGFTAPMINAYDEDDPPKADFVLWSYMPSAVEPSLRRRLSELTLHQMKLTSFHILHFMEDHSLTRLFERSLARGSQWCVVHTPGTVLKADAHKEIEFMLRNASAKTFSYGLSDQFFAVDVQKWNRLGRPRGLRAELMTGAKGAGYDCHDLPPGMQQKVGSVDPGKSPAILSDCLNHISQPLDQLTDLTSHLTEQQRETFNYLHMEAGDFGDKVFIFNTESYKDVLEQAERPPLDGLYSVSAGFKDLFILKQHGFNSGCFVTYVDISTQALFLKEYLKKNWDGRNFPAFYEHLRSLRLKELSGAVFSGNPDEVGAAWERELKAWGGAEEFARNFEAARDLPRRYIQTNFMRDPYFLARDLRERPGKNFVVWYSNCFNYTPGFVKEDWNLKNVENSGLCLLAGLREVALEQNKQVLYYGEDVLWGSRKFKWNNKASDFFI